VKDAYEDSIKGGGGLTFSWPYERQLIFQKVHDKLT
jgi:hypothetical protein